MFFKSSISRVYVILLLLIFLNQISLSIFGILYILDINYGIFNTEKRRKLFKKICIFLQKKHHALHSSGNYASICNTLNYTTYG